MELKEILNTKLSYLWNMNTNKLLLLFFIFLHQEFVHAQEETSADLPVVNPLALGGMVQGLLGMQIRPEGGFYEERYKEIFHDESNVPLANNIDRLITNHPVRNNIFSEDGKSLKGAAEGNSPNPCFNQEKIHRNRLLLLVCSLQQLNRQTTNNNL